MSSFAGDFRVAFRSIARNPGFTLAAVLTLALGIGANVAIFSVVDAVLFTPLPYRAPDRLVAIFSQFPTLGFDHFWISPPEYLELAQQARSFSGLGAYSTGAVNVSGREEPLRTEAVSATASLLLTLGVRTEIGRLYTPAEDIPHGEPVALLSDSLWRRAFAAEPGLLGRRIEVDGVRRTVLGVLPPGFQIGGRDADLVLPLALGPDDPEDRGNHYLSLVGRLRPGVSLQAARAEMATLLARWHDAIPNAHTPSVQRHPLVLRPLLDDIVGEVRPALRLLWGAVGFVLLISCANVANLLLARAESRQREVAIRTALGASRTRVLRQFFAESLVLSFLGGALGLLLASWSVKAILAVNPDSLPRFAAIHLDAKGALFTLFVSLLTGLLFGFAPALHARSGSSFGLLKEGGLRTTANAARQRLRSGLVVAEVGLAAVLVVSGGLLVRSFLALTHVDPGFRPAGVLALQVSLPEASYPAPAQVASFYDQLTERLAALPGVQSAAAMTGLPPRRDVNASDVELESLPRDPGGPPHTVDYWQYTTRDYARTMGIPLVAGRFFDRRDGAQSAPVVVINEAMAKLFWPDRSPLGQRLRRSSDEPWFTIVGIVRDVKQKGLDQKAGSEVYFLAPQVPKSAGSVSRTVNVVVRSGADPLALAGMVRGEITRLDPSLPVDKVRRLTDVVRGSMSRLNMITLLVLVFAVVALVLAAVGTYSVLAYIVAQRDQEIGIRMALGAQVGSVLGMVLRFGMRLAALGLLLGLLSSLVLGRLLASVLYGVAPTDPWTFVGVALLLTAVTLFACYLPARRAARVDPITALKGS